MKMEQTECSETSTYKIQTLGNYPEENIQHLYPSTKLLGVTTHRTTLWILTTVRT